MTEPRVSLRIGIEILDNGQISVNGFPKNAQQAIQIMNAATGTIINYFIEKAASGNLDERGNVTDENIIKPKGNIITPFKQ